MTTDEAVELRAENARLADYLRAAKLRIAELEETRDKLKQECLDYENEIASVCDEDYSLKETFDSITRQMDGIITERDRLAEEAAIAVMAKEVAQDSRLEMERLCAEAIRQRDQLHKALLIYAQAKNWKRARPDGPIDQWTNCDEDKWNGPDLARKVLKSPDCIVGLAMGKCGPAEASPR